MPAPDFENLAEQVALLKSWSAELPSSVAGAFAALDLGERTADFGERFGSWYLRVMWRDGELTKSAEVALTNAEPVPDATSESAVISVIATASTDARFVVEDIYDKRRSVKRVRTAALEEWLVAALERAHGYTASSLRQSYVTPAVPGEAR